MFPFSISVQSQAILNSGMRSSVVKAGMRGPGGGVRPAENVTEDSSREPNGVAGADAANDSSDEEEVDTDDSDVCFTLLC